jgi:hypothetical protein
MMIKNEKDIIQLIKEDEWMMNMVLCQENGHIKQREIAELKQLLFSD